MSLLLRMQVIASSQNATSGLCPEPVTTSSSHEGVQAEPVLWNKNRLGELFPPVELTLCSGAGEVKVVSRIECVS